MTPPAAGDPLEGLANLWSWFAESSTLGYSTVYTAIARAVAEDREILSLIRESAAPANIPPLLLAAVHFLLLRGLDHPLAAVYAGTAEVTKAAPLFRDVCLAHRDEVRELMRTRRVQTNEVGRSALIGPALTWASTRLPLPLRLVDVGSSAGLNLLCDRYLLDYGDHGATGDPHAEVHIECTVMGGRPPIARRLPAIGGRVGIDIDPPDLNDPDDARWLLACVWPGTNRAERTERAIAVAAAEPPEVVKGDAADLLPVVIAEPSDGTDVVITTWSFSYFSPDRKSRLVDTLERRGRVRPLVWVACDLPGVVDSVEVPQPPDHGGGSCDLMTAVVFDADGAHPHVLAFAQSHGRWLDWRAAED